MFVCGIAAAAVLSGGPSNLNLPLSTVEAAKNAPKVELTEQSDSRTSSAPCSGCESKIRPRPAPALKPLPSYPTPKNLVDVNAAPVVKAVKVAPVAEKKSADEADKIKLTSATIADDGQTAGDNSAGEGSGTDASRRLPWWKRMNPFRRMRQREEQPQGNGQQQSKNQQQTPQQNADARNSKSSAPPMPSTLSSQPATPLQDIPTQSTPTVRRQPPYLTPNTVKNRSGQTQPKTSTMPKRLGTGVPPNYVQSPTNPPNAGIQETGPSPLPASNMVMPTELDAATAPIVSPPITKPIVPPAPTPTPANKTKPNGPSGLIDIPTDGGDLLLPPGTAAAGQPVRKMSFVKDSSTSEENTTAAYDAKLQLPLWPSKGGAVGTELIPAKQWAGAVRKTALAGGGWILRTELGEELLLRGKPTLFQKVQEGDAVRVEGDKIGGRPEALGMFQLDVRTLLIETTRTN